MPKLVNLGSLCIDNVYTVPNIAGSGETVASHAHSVFPGGKGLNQSLAARRAGAEVVQVGCIGADGDFLRDVLADAGVDVVNVREIAGVSGHAVIQVDPKGQNAIVIAGGANREIASSDIEAALDLLRPDDWLLLQNEINDVGEVLDRAYARGASVAFNVAPVDGREQTYRLDGLALLIVNEVEAAALAGTNEPAAALEILCGRYPSTRVVLTRGGEGLLHGVGDERVSMGAFAVTPVDETAAGDAFIGYLMAGLLRGAGYGQSLREASAAGALAVTKAGAASSIPPPEAVIAMAGGAD